MGYAYAFISMESPSSWGRQRLARGGVGVGLGLGPSKFFFPECGFHALVGMRRGMRHALFETGQVGMRPALFETGQVGL